MKRMVVCQSNSIESIPFDNIPRRQRKGGKAMFWWCAVLFIVGFGALVLLTADSEDSQPLPKATHTRPPLSEATQKRRQEVTQYDQACSLFEQGRYDEVRALLVPLIASAEVYISTKATELNRACDVRLHIAQELPLSVMVTSQSIAVRDASRVMVRRGVVEALELLSSHPPECRRIHLYNPTADKVKPDFQVLIINTDGVIIFKHSESWLVNTLSPNESHVVSVRKSMEFPRALVFSKWAHFWDITPAYALCVGSKTSYDQLRVDLRHDLKQLRRDTPSSLDLPYEIRDLLPDVQPFSLDVPIAVSGSQIVESVTFSQASVRLRYLNRTEMRVKPNIMGYVFNKDGVIIGTFEDSWLFSSLAPAERKEKSISLSLQVPDEFVFSRWASCAYDEKPAWFLLAASSKQFDELVERTTSRLRELNISAFLKK